MFSKHTQTRSYLLIAATALCLGACSKGSSDAQKLFGGSASPSDFGDSKPTITGVALDGHWISQCHENDFGQYRIFDVTFAGNQVTRTDKTYTKSDCSDTSKDQTYKGIYRFVTKYDDASYQVEYAFDLGQGVTSFTGERVMLKDGNLLLSDFNVSVLEDEPLYKDGKVPVAPTPTTCTNYAGEWNVNGSYFHIKQVGCTEIHWVTEDYSGEDDTESVYILDGAPHVVGSQTVNSSIKNSNWNLSYTNSYSEKILMVFSLQTRPCNLMNPDGSTYLTRETYTDGSLSSCDYWGSNNN